MSSKWRIISILVAVCCASGDSGSVLAAPFDDFYIQQSLERYYEIPSDARSLGLSGASATLCEGAGCLSNNPAGLGFVKSNELYADFGSTSLDGRDLLGGQPVEQTTLLGSGVIAFPLGREDTRAEFGTLALGYSRYQGDTDDQLDTIPDGHRRSAAYGYAPSDKLSFGYTFTFYDDQLNTDLSDIHSHSRFLHLFGMQQRITDQLSLGLVFRLGIGQSDTEDYRIGSDGLSRPREYGLRLGLGYELQRVTLFGSAAISGLHSRANLEAVSPGVFIGGDEEGMEYGLSAGVEIKVCDLVKVRHGIRIRYVDYTFEREDVQDLTGRIMEYGLSGGLGVILPIGEVSELRPGIDYGIDYGSVARGHIQQLLALVVPF